METTIAAVSTGLTEAGISVIRISGPEAIHIAQKVFVSVSGKKLSEMNGYTCALGKAVSGKTVIDECIATVFRAPKSYTGEDVVELSCHGGIVVTREILRAVLQNGAVTAQAGEFTKRAFLNGKMDLIEAEAVMNLICAKSTEEAQAALAVKDGYISKEIHHIKTELMDIAAHLNAWADYPEEDIPTLEPQKIGDSIDRYSSTLHELLRRYDAGKFFSAGINTVIVGKPNVGKSTLMNRLTGLDRSIVTAVPGTTRDTVEEQIQIGSYRLNLIDTAGIRDTRDEVEKIGVERAKQKMERAQLIFFVIDMSKPLEEEDFQIYSSLPEKTPVILIFNKEDLCKEQLSSCQEQIRNQLKESAKEDKNCITDFHCALKEKLFDIGFLEKILERSFLGKDGSYAEDVISYNERQRNLIEKAYVTLEDTSRALSRGETLDAVTVLVEESIGYLAELTGENVTDEIIDRVFHRFCVGK